MGLFQDSLFERGPREKTPLELLLERKLVQKQHARQVELVLRSLKNSGLDSKALVDHIVAGNLSFDRWQSHQKIRKKEDLHADLHELEGLVFQGHQNSFRRATFLSGENAIKYSRVRKAVLERAKELISRLKGRNAPAYLSNYLNSLKRALHEQDSLHSFYFGLGLMPNEVFEGDLKDEESRIEKKISVNRGRFDTKAFKRALLRVHNEQRVPRWLARKVREKLRRL